MANFTKFGINKTEIKNGLKTSVIVKTENPSLFKSFLGFKETNSAKAETNSFNDKTSKPNRLNLDWVKSIREKYEKYL